MKITNVLFWVQDNKLAEKFYKKLGFEIIESDDAHSTVKLGDFEIVLVSMRDEEEFNKDSLASSKGLGMYVYIKVDDIDAKYNQLIAKKLTIPHPPRDWPWGNREFLIKDPDGYKLCFWQKIPESTV